MLAQRSRTGTFNWARFRAINAPFKALAVREKPNVEIMKMLVDMYPDEDKVRNWSTRIMDKRRAIIEHGGEQIQEYDQKDLKVFAPEEYRGTTKISRAYTQSLLPQLPSTILNTIYKETHMEIDMKSAFTSMLTQLFSDLDTPTMKVYTQNPDAVYSRMRRDLGMEKPMAKRVINAIICSYPNVAEDPNVGNWAEIGRNDLITAMKFEVSLWAKEIQNRYPEFYEMVSNKCDAEGKTQHIDGTALFYAASDMEHSVMREAIKFLARNGLDIVWKYDGVLVPMRNLTGKTQEQWMRELKEHVKEKTLLDVEFGIKSLHENSYGICFGPDEDAGGLTPYQRWKTTFERTFARCSNPPCFMMFAKNGKNFTDLKKCEFEHNTMEQNKAFVKQWLEDADKRMYVSRDFVPPPLQIGEGYLNLYHGIAAAGMLPNEEPVDISRYLKHVHLLMGSNDANADYMHKLIAQKIQKPGLKWRVMPIIQSVQGVGKDIWFDFLADMFGAYQCLKVDGIHKLVATNSGQMEGKLLCCLQEMGFKDTRDYEEYLKALITNQTIQLEQKYIKTFHVTNVVDFIGFTNNFGAVNVDQGDRRYFIVVADSTHAQDAAYMQPLIAFFHDDRNKRAVYDFYMGMDLSAFDSSADRPITDEHKEAASSNISIIDRFLQHSIPLWKQRSHEGDPDIKMMPHDTMRIKNATLYADFIDYAKEMGTKNADNRVSMEKFFNKMNRELGGRSHAHVTEGHEKLIVKSKWWRNRGFDLDLKGLQAYLTKTFDVEVGAEEPDVVHRQARTANRRNGRFDIKEGGEIVAVVDTLDEVNKELGEAYVETRFDEEMGIYVQFLIHPFRDNLEIALGQEYMGEMRSRIEAKYPFYVNDRCQY
jgi:hypothetical protein